MITEATTFTVDELGFIQIALNKVLVAVANGDPSAESTFFNELIKDPDVDKSYLGRAINRRCTACQAPMAERNSQHGLFFGCSNYPICEATSYRGAWRQRQFGLVLVDNFFEPSYESGKAVRFRIELATQEPFAIASLWDRWTDPATGERVVSFSMLTVNADQHPIMRQFHKPGDEKRTPVIIRPELFEAWLGADQVRAAELMTWSHMAELSAVPAPKN